MTDPTPDPDLFLARRAARADARAWDEIVERYGGRIYNLCLRFATSDAEAEDLTQEVFLKLYRQLDRYRGEVPLVAWALRLSRNLCIDHYRHARSRRQSETVSDEVLRHQAAEGDPQRDAQRRERQRWVHAVLDAMPEDLAALIEMRDLQGFSYDELAAVLELPLGTVKSRLNRARRELLAGLEARFGAAAPRICEVTP